MTIYHFSAKVVPRGKGQSAVAAAANLSGDRLQDERTGEEKYYPRQVMLETMIFAPSHSPERERLCNEVEKAEVRKRKELIHEFVQIKFVAMGMIQLILMHK